MKLDRALLAFQLAAAAALVTIAVGASREIPIEESRAPEFSVLTDDGRRIRRSDFGGKLLMINFWATWCPPCVYEMPALNELATRLAPRGLTVLAVSLDEEDAQYARFLQRLQPAFLTTRERGREMAASFGTTRIPETYIVDRSGRVVRKYVNARDWMDPAILTEIEGLLK